MQHVQPIREQDTFSTAKQEGCTSFLSASPCMGSNHGLPLCKSGTHTAELQGVVSARDLQAKGWRVGYLSHNVRASLPSPLFPPAKWRGSEVYRPCTSQASNLACQRRELYRLLSVQPLTTYMEPGTGFEPVSVALQATASPLGQPGILSLCRPNPYRLTRPESLLLPTGQRLCGGARA